jgi:haloalkane dehalogenase
MKCNSFSLLTILFVFAFFAASCEKEEVNTGEPVSTIDTLETANGIKYVRTPEARFDNLPDWPYPYKYVEIDGLRQAYVEAGPSNGEVVLLLHGQPSWSYLYRKMIPILADSGYRVIAMDHLGFGRSDKPVEITSYSYLGHYDRLTRFIGALDLQDINLFGQDWGAVIGLRVVGMNPGWFNSVVLGNGFLPNVPAGQTIYPTVQDPDSIEDIPSIFTKYSPQQVPFFDNCVRLNEDFDFAEWMVYTMKARDFTASEVLEGWTWFDLPTEVEKAYDAPFPSREYMAGARVFPSLLNETPGVTLEAWMGLVSFQKPFLTIWGGNDPLDLGDCPLQQALIDNIPGASGKPHYRFPDASHFLQDDQGEAIAMKMIDFYKGAYEGGNFGDTVETCPFDPNEDLRRYCEFLLVYLDGSGLSAEVWGTQGLNNCPSQCLGEIDLDTLKAEYGAIEINLNGPRIWLPEGNAQLPPADSRVFGTLEVRLLARIPLDPSNPPTGGFGLGDPYEESLVNRNTVYEYTVDDLPTLGSTLQLPTGWTYQARTLSEDLILTADGEATIVTDDLGNTYQKRTP